MLWKIHIATSRVVDGELEVDIEYLEVPNTSSMADVRSAIILASKTFKTSHDNILCIPAAKAKK